MRVCVIGAGIAGTLLAWRLSESVEVDLVTGPPGTDATAASGGGVRGFETHPVQRRLAIESLAELFETLQEEAGYTETGCTYLLPSYAGLETGGRGGGARAPGLDRDPRSRPAAPPGLARTARRHGRRLREAGRLHQAGPAAGGGDPANSPAAPGAGSWKGRYFGWSHTPDGSVSCRLPGLSQRRYDVVVVAAGPWTPGLLAGSALPGRAVPDEGDPDRHLRGGRRFADHVRGRDQRPVRAAHGRRQVAARCGHAPLVRPTRQQQPESRTWPPRPSGSPASGCHTSSCRRPATWSATPTVMPIRRY